MCIVDDLGNSAAYLLEEITLTVENERVSRHGSCGKILCRCVMTQGDTGLQRNRGGICQACIHDH